MSSAAVTIAYDGAALKGGVMDVRDLAPALLAVGQLVDAANATLNGDSARVSVQVTATGSGSFEIYLQVSQSIGSQLASLFTSEPLAAASTVATLVFGTPAAKGVIWLIRRCKGKKPERIERLSDSTVRLVIDGETIEIPLHLLRLYQDIAVRTAAQRLIEEPLQKNGIESFEIRSKKNAIITIHKNEAHYFIRPDIPDEILIDDTRRSAYSIISLAFKEDNKWRLNDGNNPISASIEDIEFLARVDANQISFSKGDILICDVRVMQKRTDHGLKTEYNVIKVVDHRAAARQLPLAFTPTESPEATDPPTALHPSPTPPAPPEKT